MKIQHALLPTWLLFVLLVLVGLNFVSAFFGLNGLKIALSLVLVPLLLIVYSSKETSMGPSFISIFLLFFLGIIFRTLEHYMFFSKLSETCYLAAYMLLMFLMLGKLRGVKFEGFVSLYLVVVFLINAYLMYLMFISVKSSFQDGVDLFLNISRGVALLIMGFSAFAIYLSRESEQSIIFLLVICCLVFSDALNFITTMYVGFWLFESLQYTLQTLGLLLFCIYVYNYHKREKILLKPIKDEEAPKNHIPA